MLLQLKPLFLAVAVVSIPLLRVTAKASPEKGDFQLDLERANAFLAQGKYSDAISLYDDVIQKDKLNYLSYYKRALSYLGLSRYNSAIADLNSVLEIQPDFSAALLQRGKLLSWQGDFTNAIKDLQKAGKQNDLINGVKDAEKALKEAQNAEKKGDYQKCMDSARAALSVATGLASLWQLRAKCALAHGDSEGAVSDLTQASKLVNTAEINIQLSNLLFYSLNDVDGALNAVKKCLHHDPENTACKKGFRKLKNASKSITQLQQAVQRERWQEALAILINDGFLEQIKAATDEMKKDNILKSNTPQRLLAQLEEWACQSFSNTKKSQLAMRHCDVALQLNPDSIPALLAKSQALISSESYDEAIRLLNKANEVTGGQNHQIRQQLDRAQKLLRQSKKRDYYKILGVPRDADSKAIRKAYRDMSKKYHPDKYRGDLDEDAISLKMAEINSAYEVLSNEELRTRYDNGDDPNDHEGQQGYPGGQPFFFQQGQPFFFQQGGKPFQQGGKPFQGQGGNYKFHFGF